MPQDPVRIKADNFFPLDIQAEGRAPHSTLQAPQGPHIERYITGWDTGRIRTRPT